MGDKEDLLKQAKEVSDYANPTDADIEDVKSIFCNPIFTGIAPFPKMIEDDLWIKSAKNLIEKIGIDDFLKGMLKALRATYGKVQDDIEKEADGGK